MDSENRSYRRKSYLARNGYRGYRTRVELVRENEELYEPIRLSRPQEVYEFMANIRNADRELLYSIMLDTQNLVIGCEEVSRGSLNTTRTHPREIYKSAILANSQGLILSHNHPSGLIEPSPEDIEFTNAIKSAGDLLGIELYDHVIVTDYGYASLRERGVL